MTVNEALEAVINQKPVQAKVRVSLDKEIFTYRYIEEVCFFKGRDGTLKCAVQVHSMYANSVTSVPVEDVEYLFRGDEENERVYK